MFKPLRLAAASFAANFALPLTATLAQAQSDTERYYYGPHMMGEWGWGGMIFGPFFAILMLAVAIAVGVWLVRWLGGPGQPPGGWHHTTPPGRAPLDILKERYARGEIDKEEFEERRRTLSD